MKYPTEATLRRIVAFVATLGVGVATYITIADSGGGAPTCLAGGGGCETVANSSYSHIAGINVAVFGIVGYLAILATAFFADDLARFAGFALALGGFGFSVYLTYLEVFTIEAICQWCVSSAVLMTVLFGLNAARLVGYAGTGGAGARARRADALETAGGDG
ncbi:MAG: hypothetical protein QOI84_430 [Solirubrobacterales bacterium]|jgi:uncharacterized membrane protein|nr:hypothetical protein [Solirubrobacterales bacterium]